MSEKQELGPNQQKWLAALRSGKYKQGERFLRDLQDNYCCLGVLVELCGIEGVQLRPEDTYYNYPDVVDDNGDTRYRAGVACDLAKDFVALHSASGTSHAPGSPTLIHLNDSGASFSEIADIIEANPAAYFKEPK